MQVQAQAQADLLPSSSPNQTHPHKTLPHALARAATAGATELGDDRLGSALKAYGSAQAKVRRASLVTSSSPRARELTAVSLHLVLQVGEARLSQDEEITTRFVHPFQQTLSTSIAIAVRARNSVKQARLELDSARQILKNAGVGPKGEQARLDVENAEDKLVQAVSLWRDANRSGEEREEHSREAEETKRADSVAFL